MERRSLRGRAGPDPPSPPPAAPGAAGQVPPPMNRKSGGGGGEAADTHHGVLNGGLQHLRAAAGAVSGHRAVLCTERRAAAHGAGIPAGQPQHGLFSRCPVPAGHLPICGGHPGGAGRDLSLRHRVLVPGLLLFPGAAHPRARLHPRLLPPADHQHLRGERQGGFLPLVPRIGVGLHP